MSVTFAIAETTVTTGRRCFCSVQICAATFMRSAEPMLVPPNFITNSPLMTPARAWESIQLESSSVGSFLAIRGAITDDFEQRGLDFILRQPGAVHVHGIGGLNQRRLRAHAIAFVALHNLTGNDIARLPGLQGAALGANLRLGVEKNFYLRVWKYNGSEVAPFHHGGCRRA